MKNGSHEFNPYFVLAEIGLYAPSVTSATGSSTPMGQIVLHVKSAIVANLIACNFQGGQL